MHEFGYVTASSGLNLRAAPTIDADVLLTIPHGQPVALLGTETAGWLGAQVGTLCGYVWAAHIDRRAVRTTFSAPLLAELSATCRVDPLLVQAVVQVESGGRAFAHGRLIIRFEPHLFIERLSGNDRDKATVRFQVGSPTWDGAQHRLWRSGWSPFHGNQDMEYIALNMAREVNVDLAVESTSLGAPQILGGHWNALGYASAQAMFYAFANSADEQLRAFFHFLEVSGALKRLRKGDLRGFASLYNGPAQADRYAALLTAAVARLRGAA